MSGQTEAEPSEVSEDGYQHAATATHGTLFGFLGPALRRPERMLRHAHGVQQSRAGVSGKANRAAVETHALDDDRAIIGGIRPVDSRAFVSAGRELIAGADAVTVGKSSRVH